MLTSEQKNNPGPVNKNKKNFFLGVLSIQSRLTLLICTLLLGVIIVFSWVSYLTVKRSASDIGEQRLKTLANQLSQMLTQSARNVLASVRTEINSEPVRQYLAGNEESKSAVLETLERLRPDTTYVVTELLDGNQNQLLSSGRNNMSEQVNFRKLVREPLPHDSVSVGKIYLVGGSMFYPVTISVRNQNKTMGFIVRWRLLLNSPQAMNQLSQLLGKADLYIGNADGSLWTDLITPVAAPPLKSVNAKGILEYERAGGNQVMGALQPIGNTPWVVLVEFSQQTVFEAANRFLRWVIFAGGILILIGIVAAWLMSRNITRPLNKLTAASAAIAAGHYSFPVALNRRDEVGELARAFNTMIEQIRITQGSLEQKIAETIEMNAKLRSLSAHLQDIQEEERKHIAREMHDELGQLLTGFKMDISSLNKTLANYSDPVVKEKLSGMKVITDDAVNFVRKLAAELRPSILDDLGLVAALKWHTQEFVKRYSIDVDFYSEPEQLDVSPVSATALFRMYQESLTNVARHAEAKHVSAMLTTTDRIIHLSIQDDGKGFDVNAAGTRQTLGLLGMKERAGMMGGNLEITSAPGKGTTITIEVPFGANQ